MNVYDERKKNVCENLRKGGFDKALVGDPMSMLYLTGNYINPYERFYGLVINASDNSIHMINPSVDTGCMKGVAPEHVYQDSDGPARIIEELVGDCHTLAVETKYYSMAIGEILHQLKCEVKDIGNVLASVRMYKDEDEIEQMQYAAKIVDEAIVFISDKIKIGMTEKELNKMLYDYMCTYKGFLTDEVIILVLAAANSANCHGTSGDYAFKKGDIILLDFCAYYNYYWSDITRCLFVDEAPDAKLVEIYDIVLGANLAAIAKVKPGITAKEVDKAARDYITDAGYGELFLHRTGHGLGLSVHEEPYITSVNDLILEEGMTFTIEPGIYIDGLGGVRIEDDILVTKDGCITLTHSSKKLEDHIVKTVK
ncbi:MAG: Xaa-Pro peptidase family protein [Lachnospiraceae bacterium]